MKSALDILRERGFVAQVTFEDELEKLFESGEVVTFYTGFDPHRRQPAHRPLHPHHGHEPSAEGRTPPHRADGRGTAMVGDPSGKTDMRRC
jgi:tyrosyl-tRNA synthetase